MGEKWPLEHNKRDGILTYTGEYAVDVRHHVVTIHTDRLIRAVAQRHVQHCATRNNERIKY